VPRVSRSIKFYRPSPAVFAVSITGGRCELNCPHCEGRYLESMERATMPPDVIRAFDKAKSEGASCVLISGGFTRRGRLPVDGMVDAIREGKERTGLKVEVHSGVIEDATISALARAGVDAILIDVIGDDLTIREYLGGRWSVADYRRAMASARASSMRLLAPHVLIGVDRGKIRGEHHAVDIISEARPDSCAMLVLTDGASAPDEAEAEKVMEYARDRLDCHLTLGCMHGRGAERQKYERIAVNLGYDGIANPSQETERAAVAAGIEVVWKDGCCVFP